MVLWWILIFLLQQAVNLAEVKTPKCSSCVGNRWNLCSDLLDLSRLLENCLMQAQFTSQVMIWWVYKQNLELPFVRLLFPYLLSSCCAACVPSGFSHVWLFATTWTVACRAPLSMRISRQEYWSIYPPGDLPDPCDPCLSHWQAGSLPLAPPGNPSSCWGYPKFCPLAVQSESLSISFSSFILACTLRKQMW